MAVPASIAILEVEARFHGERLALYRARHYGFRRAPAEGTQR